MHLQMQYQKSFLSCAHSHRVYGSEDSFQTVLKVVRQKEESPLTNMQLNLHLDTM